MKNVFLFLFTSVFFIACDNKKIDYKSYLPNDIIDEKIDDLSILRDDESRFYVLEGRVDDSDIYMYLNVSKEVDEDGNSSNDIKVSGIYYDVNLNREFNVSSKISSKDQAIFNITDNDSFISSFSGNIFQDGSIDGIFMDNGLYKNGTIAKFVLSDNKISRIDFVTSVFKSTFTSKDYDNQDREYSYYVEEQRGLILNGNDDKTNKVLLVINNDLGSIDGKFTSSNIEQLRENMANFISNQFNTDKKNINSNYEYISTLSVDYTDDKIISFSNVTYLYKGGANGINNENTITYSLEDGRKISNDLSQLLKDKNDLDFKKFLLDKLSLNNIKPMLENGLENMPLPSFKIKNTGVEFYWGMYEIAPRSSGVIKLNIKFNELVSFVNRQSPYAYLFFNNVN